MKLYVLIPKSPLRGSEIGMKQYSPLNIHPFSIPKSIPYLPEEFLQYVNLRFPSFLHCYCHRLIQHCR
jgi:hypothetical protein